VPWIGSRIGTCVAGYGSDSSPIGAVSNALRGACIVGRAAPGTLDPIQCNHLLAMDAMLHGAPALQVARTYRVDPHVIQQVVGSMVNPWYEGNFEPLLVRF